MQDNERKLNLIEDMFCNKPTLMLETSKSRPYGLNFIKGSSRLTTPKSLEARLEVGSQAPQISPVLESYSMHISCAALDNEVGQ